MSKLIDFFPIYNPVTPVSTLTDSQGMGDGAAFSSTSWYQRLVHGSASRMNRYREYDLMDNDIEIARSLDTIADEMIGSDPNQDTPLIVKSTRASKQIDATVADTINACLDMWVDQHNIRDRLHQICRGMIKYGDYVYYRETPNRPWRVIHPKNIVAAVVNEKDVSQVLGWRIRLEQQNNIASYQQAMSSSDEVVDASKIIRFSLNDESSESAPFGESVLRSVYRTFKQKELLEDAIIIYRVQRAPERRVFYLGVGKLHPTRVKAYLEQYKNEMNQRKVPLSNGSGGELDSVYNPQQMMEDFFFPVRPDGGNSRVETLPGGQNLGNLEDLHYFENKIFRGLRIPPSHMGITEGASFNDGKVGTAYIQELRFAMYVKRLASKVSQTLDREFKLYLRAANIVVPYDDFRIGLIEPENFGIYKQQQLNNDLLNTYTTISADETISTVFAQKHYLNLSDVEIQENIKLLLEERGLDYDSLSAKERIQKAFSPTPDGVGDIDGGDVGGLSMTSGGPDMGALDMDTYDDTAPPIDPSSPTDDEVPLPPTQ